MMKYKAEKIKKLFLFLIPTLIAALVFISISQQSIFVLDDSDSATDFVKVEPSNKHSNLSIFNLDFFIPDQNNNAPILSTSGIVFVFIFLSNHHNSAYSIKNRSPPISAVV